MLELAPTTLYMPFFLPGTADIAFISARFCAIAARLTERCNAHATRPRQARIAAPKNARMAPTQMKTVPSGKSDFCINAAPAVLGIFGVGIPRPASVVSPVNEKAGPSSFEESVAADELGADVVEDSEVVVPVCLPLVRVICGAVASVLVSSSCFEASVVGSASVLDSSSGLLVSADVGGAVVSASVVAAGAVVGAGADVGAGLLLLFGTPCARTDGATRRARPRRPNEGRMEKVVCTGATVGVEVYRAARLRAWQQL
jgi:hypothetical protein